MLKIHFLCWNSLIWLDWVKVITWISKLWRFNSQTPWRMNFVIFDFELITGKYRTSDDLLRMIVQQNTWKQLEKVEKTSWPNGMLFWNVYSDVIIVYKQRYKQRRWKKGLQTVSVIRLHEFYLSKIILESWKKVLYLKSPAEMNIEPALHHCSLSHY